MTAEMQSALRLNPPAARPLERAVTTFPADEVVWGVVVKNGFDELDDPWYHRGVTQHAYLEGNDSVSLCGFRPPLSGPRDRRRARLMLPTSGVHPMCGTCARRVVAPRQQSRVSVPVTTERAPVAVPVARPRTGVPVAPASPAPVAAGSHAAAFAPRATTSVGAPAPLAEAAAPASAPRRDAVSPWVTRAQEEGRSNH
jgi:hypothetical protein